MKMETSTLKVDRFTVFLAIASTVGVALILLRETTYGVSLHWDGINYIAVARNILDGDILHGFQEKPFTRWPPLYPILLALTSFFVFDPYDVAGPVSAALFGLTIFVAGIWMRQRLASRFLVIWGFLALMLSIPLTWMATWALSEPLFILVAVLALVRTDEFLIEGKFSSLIWAAVFTAMACLTRWTGVTVIMTILPLLVLQRGVRITEKTRRIAIYSVISTLPVGLYMLRNVLLVGHPTGSLKSPANSLENTIDAVLGSVGRWIFPDLSWATTGTIPQLLAGVILLALSISVMYLVLLGQRKTNVWSKWGSLSIFGGFVVTYVIFFLISAVVVGGTELGTSYRYFTVIFVPFTIAFVLVIDRLSSHIGQRILNGVVSNLPIFRTKVRGGGGVDSY